MFRRLRRQRPGLALVALVLVSCGSEVTVEQPAEPIDLCACWVARQVEPLPDPPNTLGPCNMCWAATVMGDSSGNGLCHFNQQRCLEDDDCIAVVTCVQGCVDSNCVNGCMAAAPTEIGHDLFLDWSRCFCMECWDVCAGVGERGACSAAG